MLSSPLSAGLHYEPSPMLSVSVSLSLCLSLSLPLPLSLSLSPIRMEIKVLGGRVERPVFPPHLAHAEVPAQGRHVSPHQRPQTNYGAPLLGGETFRAYSSIHGDRDWLDAGLRLGLALGLWGGQGL